MVEVCSDCVGMCVFMWYQPVIWGKVHKTVFTIFLVIFVLKLSKITEHNRCGGVGGKVRGVFHDARPGE